MTFIGDDMSDGNDAGDGQGILKNEDEVKSDKSELMCRKNTSTLKIVVLTVTGDDW